MDNHYDYCYPIEETIVNNYDISEVVNNSIEEVNTSTIIYTQLNVTQLENKNETIKTSEVGITMKTVVSTIVFFIIFATIIQVICGLS